MSTTNHITKKHNTETRTLRRANDAAKTVGLKPPAHLFDEFWRDGELALLFGEAGVGKSLLAVEIADRLARGRAMEGLQMPTARSNVLYVDLVLSDEQFALRYSRETRRGTRRAYQFSTAFYRDRPPDGAPLIDWLRDCVASQKMSAVIIDDLSMIAQTADGTRETLALMRELRRMTRELGLSVLVLADSHPYVFQRRIAERDLRRNRVLCGVADSVSAIEPATRPDDRILVQTRSQAAELVWTHSSPAVLTLDGGDDGFVGFTLETPELCPVVREMIVNIKRRHYAGESFRSIARSLNISKSTAARLYAKWKWQFEKEEHIVPVREETAHVATENTGITETASSPPYEGGVDVPTFLVGTDGVVLPSARNSDQSASQSKNHPVPTKDVGPPLLRKEGSTLDPSTKPFAAARARRSIHDLELAIDAGGSEIYVESREAHTGKPRIWYKRGRDNQFSRYERSLYGIQIKPIGVAPTFPAV